MYSIGQVSQMFDIPCSTLRYYDKEGLFPNIVRNSGIRSFTHLEIETIRVIECLKISGLEIKDIKQFIAWCQDGSSTYEKRRELFVQREETLNQELERIQRSLAMIKFKKWYYDEAIARGSEDYARSLLPNKLPKEIQELYDFCHKEDKEKFEKEIKEVA